MQSTESNTGPGLSLIVPLYQESAGVVHSVDALAAWLPSARQRRPVQLIFVDDGSSDGTGEQLREALDRVGEPEAQVLRHPENRGLSAAMVTGAREAQHPWIAFLDSDLTYRAEFVTTLLDASGDGVDVVLASPYHPDGAVEGVAGWRRALSSAASGLWRLAARREIHTYTAMVRLWRRSVWEECLPEHPGFLGVTESLLRAIRQGRRIQEVAAVLHRRRQGQSKMRVLAVAAGHGRLLLRWLGRRL